MPRPFKMVKSATHTHMYNYTETHVNGQKSTKLLPQSVFLSIKARTQLLVDIYK